MTVAEHDAHLAAGIITAREHDVLTLRHRGLSQYTIALALDISRSGVRYLEQNANAKIARHRRSTAA